MLSVSVISLFHSEKIIMIMDIHFYDYYFLIISPIWLGLEFSIPKQWADNNSKQSSPQLSEIREFIYFFIHFSHGKGAWLIGRTQIDCQSVHTVLIVE